MKINDSPHVQKPNKLFSQIAAVDLTPVADTNILFKSAIHISQVEDEEDSVQFMGKESQRAVLVM